MKQKQVTYACGCVAYNDWAVPLCRVHKEPIAASTEQEVPEIEGFTTRTELEGKAMKLAQRLANLGRPSVAVMTHYITVFAQQIERETREKT
jgi:hypothetical protein